jgi:HK97 family phage portal protein
MVAPNGNVYYAIQQDRALGCAEPSLVVPAREIIHDRIFPLYHPLCGLSPVYACGHAAMQGLKIIHNTTRLFENGTQVGGVLTAPQAISEDTAARLEKYWQDNYSGDANIGKIAVLGNDLKFEKPPAMSAVDAQLIDQLKWDDEKICSTFHVPPYMVGVGSSADVQQHRSAQSAVLFAVSAAPDRVSRVVPRRKGSTSRIRSISRVTSPACCAWIRPQR